MKNLRWDLIDDSTPDGSGGSVIFGRLIRADLDIFNAGREAGERGDQLSEVVFPVTAAGRCGFYDPSSLTRPEMSLTYSRSACRCGLPPPPREYMHPSSECGWRLILITQGAYFIG